MSIASIYQDQETKIGGITFDCVLKESLIAEYEGSDYAVENKSIMTDHVRKKPKSITVTVAIGDQAFASGASALLSTGIGAAAGAVAKRLPPWVTGVVGAGVQVGMSIAEGMDDSETRSAAAMRKFIELADKCEAFDLVTTKMAYKNVYIKSITQETTPDNEGMVEMVVEMKEIPLFDVEQETLLADGSGLAPGSSEEVTASGEYDYGSANMEAVA